MHRNPAAEALNPSPSARRRRPVEEAAPGAPPDPSVPDVFDHDDA
jgi:hypothetical protein